MDTLSFIVVICGFAICYGCGYIDGAKIFKNK